MIGFHVVLMSYALQLAGLLHNRACVFYYCHVHCLACYAANAIIAPQACGIVVFASDERNHLLLTCLLCFRMDNTDRMQIQKHCHHDAFVPECRC